MLPGPVDLSAVGVSPPKEETNTQAKRGANQQPCAHTRTGGGVMHYDNSNNLLSVGFSLSSICKK